MNFLANNQNFLKKINISFAQDRERDFAASDDARYEKKGAHYSGERKDVRCFLQSKYSVADELKNMFSLTLKNTECIILFGAGQLEAVRYALDMSNFPELKTLVVIEPSPEWFSIVMKEVDLENIIGQNVPEVLFFIGYRADKLGGSLASSFIAVSAENYSLVYHLSVRSLFQEYYEDLVAGIIDCLRNIPMVFASNKSQITTTIFNEILNLTREAYNFEDIMELFKKKTVLIVSAGPSLQKNIHLLKDAKKKAVVAAVGSAIRILDEHGITPHFNVALDPMPNLHTIFGNLKNKNVPLLYTSVLYPEVLKRYEGPLICVNTKAEKLILFLRQERGENFPVFDSGPTVANVAAELFCALGIKKLIFTGQDMCMYNYRLYAADDEYTAYKKMHQEQDKFMMHLKDIYGSDVVSPRNYYIIKEFLEGTVINYSHQIEFVNATEGGLGIKGVPDEILFDVLESLPEDDIAPDLEKQLKKLEKFDLRPELYQLKKEIDAIEILNNENVETLEKIKTLFVQDEFLSEKETYIEAFKNAGKNEKKMKEIKFHQVVQKNLEMFLESDCLKWGQKIDSPDLKVRFNSILEIQLRTAQATKLFLETTKIALNEVFSEDIKVKRISVVAV